MTVLCSGLAIRNAYEAEIQRDLFKDIESEWQIGGNFERILKVLIRDPYGNFDMIQHCFLLSLPSTVFTFGFGGIASSSTCFGIFPPFICHS